MQPAIQDLVMNAVPDDNNVLEYTVEFESPMPLPNSMDLLNPVCDTVRDAFGSAVGLTFP